MSSGMVIALVIDLPLSSSNRLDNGGPLLPHHLPLRRAFATGFQGVLMFAVPNCQLNKQFLSSSVVASEATCVITIAVQLAYHASIDLVG